MSAEQLKKSVLEAIDRRAEEITGIGDAIWKKPELGYKEFETAKLVEQKYKEMGWAIIEVNSSCTFVLEATTQIELTVSPKEITRNISRGE